ncbi:MAG: hypothetical protein DYG89_38935 [Caldilinea sp. CFX5]|nr:hypothetical protein [Caldilinea sp. CFX5]
MGDAVIELVEITASPHHRITASPHHRITASPHHRITASPHHRIYCFCCAQKLRSRLMMTASDATASKMSKPKMASRQNSLT